MILFVFEGAKREPDLFRAIETLFFQDKQNIVCSFGNNIYELYNELQSFEGDGDIVSILKERYQGQKDSPFTDDAKSSDFSEIYLIFDYDFQNSQLSPPPTSGHPADHIPLPLVWLLVRVWMLISLAR